MQVQGFTAWRSTVTIRQMFLLQECCETNPVTGSSCAFLSIAEAPGRFFFLAITSEVNRLQLKKCFKKKATDVANTLREHPDCYQVWRLLVQNTTHWVVLLQVLCNWMVQTDKNLRAEKKKGELRKPCKKTSLAEVNGYTSVLYESKPTQWDSFKIISHSALWQPVTSRLCISRWFK